MKSTDFRYGFTLIELMVTVAIVAVTLTIGVPSFREMVRNNQMSAQTNALIAALNMARSESVKRGGDVTFCKRNTAGTACNNAGKWEDGWLLFIDANGDGVLDDDGDTNLCEVGEDCVVHVFDPLPQGFTLRAGANFACWVSYRSSGMSHGSGSDCSGGGLSNDGFRLCYGSDTAKSRTIVVNTVGRVTYREGTASCP